MVGYAYHVSLISNQDVYLTEGNFIFALFTTKQYGPSFVYLIECEFFTWWRPLTSTSAFIPFSCDKHKVITTPGHWCKGVEYIKLTYILIWACVLCSVAVTATNYLIVMTACNDLINNSWQPCWCTITSTCIAVSDMIVLSVLRVSF